MSNVTEWNSAVSAINSGGGNKNYIINITANFSVPGTTSYNFTPSDLNISIRGNKTLSLSSNGSLLRINGQRIIIRDLTLKGRKNGVDGATSDNDASLIYMYGTVELKGTASITGNVLYRNSLSDYANAQRYGGGVDLEGGTFIMWDNSSITGNSVITSGTPRSWALGGGIYNYGTLIMRGNSSITNNTATANGDSYTQQRFGFGGGVFVGPGKILRIEGGTISGNTANVKGSALYLFASNGGTDDFGIGNDNSIAQRGTFSGDTWTSMGNLSTTNSNITVENGVLK